MRIECGKAVGSAANERVAARDAAAASDDNPWNEEFNNEIIGTMSEIGSTTFPFLGTGERENERRISIQLFMRRWRY